VQVAVIGLDYAGPVTAACHGHDVRGVDVDVAKVDASPLVTRAPAAPTPAGPNPGITSR
jgi:UDP-N-acetyl-D-mannosaminuronate dehydrogenase